MSKIVACDGDPYDSGQRIWGDAMGMAQESPDIMWPLWLLWGALTDWVEAKPEEADAASKAMRRAAGEWLDLPPQDGSARAIYFDRWLYDEMGLERPGGA